MLISINNFKGVNQAIDPTLLPYNFAQIAENCDLRTGRLKALKDLLTTKTWTAAAVGAIRSLYKEESADKWLYWTESDISIVKAQVPDGNNRLAYTGDGYPKQTDNTLFPSTGKPDATNDYRRLGVKPPTVTLTINGPYGSGDGVTKYSVSYYYTYVVKWADGTEEESKPVAATAVVDIEGGEYLALSGFVKPVLATSGNNVTHFRVYRLESSYTGAEYQLVKMRPGSSGAGAVYDLPVADVPNNTTLVYDCDATPDDLNSNLSDVCPSENWDYPPDNLAQIGQYQNGILAGFSGKTFCVSESFIHYAWPASNKVPLSYDPVAWGTYRGMAIIATTAFPTIVTGADSTTLMQETLPYSQKCLSARGFVMTDIGALYPSPDGLVLINEDGLKVLTKNVLTKKQWDDLPPAGFDHGDLVSFYYDNIYIGFWAGSTKGFIYNFLDEPYYTTFTLTDTIYHGCIDPTTDTLYLLTNITTNYYAKAWEAGATYLMGRFKSKKHIVPNMAFTCARIIGNQSSSVPVGLKVYGDGGNSIDFVNSAPTSCCTDPDDDQDVTTGWTASLGAISSEAGGDTGNCLKVLENGGGPNPSAYKTSITVGAGQLWQFTGKVKSDGSEATYQVNVWDNQGVAEIWNSRNLESANDWTTTWDKIIKIPNGCTSVLIRVKTKSGAASGTHTLFDDVSFSKLRTITDTDIFALQLDTEHELYEIEGISKAEIDKIIVATSPEEIIQAMAG